MRALASVCPQSGQLGAQVLELAFERACAASIRQNRLLGALRRREQIGDREQQHRRRLGALHSNCVDDLRIGIHFTQCNQCARERRLMGGRRGGA